jgi:glycosyltransferase involved in cell wall biosynthesis
MICVSAIVPTCNRPGLLERALRSIAAQELAPTEIIIVDDAGIGSNDSTFRVLQRCGLRAAHLVANSRAKGASGARNTGAAVATGDLLAFLDDDDEWLPSYLAEALHAFTSRELDVMCTDLLCQFDDGIEREGKASPDRLLPELFLTRNPGLVGSNFIIRRSLYRKIGGFDESLPTCNDRDFGIRLSLSGDVRYGRLFKRLVRHHQHKGPKLCTPNGEAMRAGVRRFYAIHGHRMSETQREQFRHNVRDYWGIDEQGQTLNLPQSAFYESLIPMLKARLDQQRHRKDQ